MMTLAEYEDYSLWKTRRKQIFVDDKRERPNRDYWELILSNERLAWLTYLEERKRFRYQEKQEQIIHALETLKANGIDAQLSCFDNCHIQAKSKSGKIMSYYAGTGTITGYGETHIEGIDEFIRLLKTI